METFVVRVWTPGSAEAPDTDTGKLHGVVEHPSTGRHERFTAGEELLAFLRLQAERGTWERGKEETP